MMQNVTKLNTTTQKVNTATNPFITPQRNKKCPKQLPYLVIISPAKNNCHRKVTLKDVDIDEDTKKQLETLCSDYVDIISKHNGHMEN